MWVSPNHPDPPRPAEPPEDAGELLAVFPRGEGCELRVTLAEWQGRPFVSLRVWEADPRDGRWWPVKGKGCSVRIGEAPELARVLAAVGRRGSAPGRQEARQRAAGPRAARNPAPARSPRRGASGASAGRSAAGVPPVAPGGSGFDEFGSDPPTR